MQKWIWTLAILAFWQAPTYASETMEVSVKLTVPDAAWTVSIVEAHQVGEELWVISKLQRPDVMAAQVISEVTDTVKIQTPPLTVRHFILGKTWNWKNSEPYTFLDRREDIADQVKTGRPLFMRNADDEETQVNDS